MSKITKEFYLTVLLCGILEGGEALGVQNPYYYGNSGAYYAQGPKSGMGMASAAPMGGRVDGALQQLQALALQGNTGAQYELGLRYARGAGVQPSVMEAARWLRMAAAQGHMQALADLRQLEMMAAQGQIRR